MVADVRKDGVLDNEKIVRRGERATGLVLVVVRSEFLEVDDFLDVFDAILLNLELGLLGVLGKEADFSAGVHGLGEGEELALHVALDGVSMEKDFDVHRRACVEQLRLGSLDLTQLGNMCLQCTRSEIHLFKYNIKHSC